MDMWCHKGDNGLYVSISDLPSVNIGKFHDQLCVSFQSQKMHYTLTAAMSHYMELNIYLFSLHSNNDQMAFSTFNMDP